MIGFFKGGTSSLDESPHTPSMVPVKTYLNSPEATCLRLRPLFL